ncbi:MAG: hypothetical protein HY888_09585 [Deltaproteobacteria bacterium]|nr:hypothetical protein [Deltaproteobacteria bacterium]
MIISPEHNDLLEEFKKANEIERETIKAMSDYTTATPNPDKAIAKELFKRFEDAFERKMALYIKLKEFDLSEPNG